MNYSVDTDLLIQYFSGLASPEAALRVDEWRKSDQQNELFFQELFASWTKDKNYQAPNIDQEWQAFENKINAPKVTSRSRVLRWLPYAAILIITLGIGLWQFNQQSKTELLSFEYQQNNFEFELKKGAKVSLEAQAKLEEKTDAQQHYFALMGNATFAFETSYPDFKLLLPSGIWLKDIGTIFSVTGDEKYTRITVREGIVEVWSSKERLPVRKNQELYYFKDLDKFVIDDFKGNFDYKDYSLQQICDSVGAYFHVNMQTENSSLADRKLTLRGKNLALHQVVEIITTTLDIHYGSTDRDNFIFKSN